MIDEKLIQVEVPVLSKDEVFDYLSQLVVKQGYATDPTSVKEALFEREKEGTTGMMDGFAIPHAKSSNITKPGVAVLKLAHGVDWQSMDGQAIRYVIALFIPEAEAGTTHLQLLSKIARLLMKTEFKKSFAKATSEEEIIGVLKEYL